jgi:hypothetical protein
MTSSWFDGSAKALQSTFAEPWLLLLLPAEPLELVVPPEPLLLVVLLGLLELEPAEPLELVVLGLVVELVPEPPLPVVLLLPLVRDDDEAAGSDAQLTAHNPPTIDQNTALLLGIASPLYAAQREPDPRP